MINELKQIDKQLTDIEGEAPVYRNSEDYRGTEWLPLDELDVFPSQRRLGKYECVMDLDDVSKSAFNKIPAWLEATGFKFSAWMSGPKGMHIHFWTDMSGKETKKELVRELSKKLEEKFGVKNDLLPMGHGFIRTEHSIHPEKGYRKNFLSSNLSVLFPFNDISPTMRQKVLKTSVSRNDTRVAASGQRDGKIPTCMKYILSHQFADGRKRLMFIVASWFVSSYQGDKKAAAKATWEWCQKQGGRFTTYSKVWSTVHSTTGGVGCRLRHEVLEELGIDMSDCRWE